MYRASNWLINAIKAISADGLISKFFLASIFTGIATSIPELFVSITASLEDSPNIAFGNAIGSNIANIGLVFALAVILSPYIFNVKKENFSIKTTLLLLTSSLFPFLLAIDGSLSRIDGLFLIALFLVYLVYILNKSPSKKHQGLEVFLHKLEKSLHRKKIRNAVLMALGSVFVLLVSSHILIKSATYISTTLSVRPFLVAVFIIAPGTSLPELFVALASLKKKEVDVLYGDIFGSLVANANLVIGLGSVILPYRFSIFPEYLVSLLGLLGIFTLFIVFSLSKRKFEKWEAFLLLGFYLLFFFVESSFR